MTLPVVVLQVQARVVLVGMMRTSCTACHRQAHHAHALQLDCVQLQPAHMCADNSAMMLLSALPAASCFPLLCCAALRTSSAPWLRPWPGTPAVWRQLTGSRWRDWQPHCTGGMGHQQQHNLHHPSTVHAVAMAPEPAHLCCSLLPQTPLGARRPFLGCRMRSWPCRSIPSDHGGCPAVLCTRRLNLQPGHDVRCSAALLTYKMAAITSRAGPSGGVGPVGQGK